MLIDEKTLWQIFEWGVDYGQLLMEEERDGEDWADAFQGAIIDRKYCKPSQIAPRRQPHSENWRNAKKESMYQFMMMVGKLREQEKPDCGSMPAMTQ